MATLVGLRTPEEPMRVVTSGRRTWGHRTLQALLDSEHDVVPVATHPVSEPAHERI